MATPIRLSATNIQLTGSAVLKQVFSENIFGWDAVLLSGRPVRRVIS